MTAGARHMMVFLPMKKLRYDVLFAASLAVAMLTGCGATQQTADTIEQTQQAAQLADVAKRIEQIYTRAPDIDVISIEPDSGTSTLRLRLKSKDAALDSFDFHQLKTHRDQLKNTMCREFAVRDDSGLIMEFTILSPQGRLAVDKLTISHAACQS